MRAVYRWYSRASARLSCNPAVVGVGIVLLAFTYIGGAAIYQHRSQVIAEPLGELARRREQVRAHDRSSPVSS